MFVWEFEKNVWEVEGIRIIIRADSKEKLGDFDWKNAAAGNSTVADWLKNRISPRINGFSVAVIGGDGEEVHKGKLLERVRNSYKDY